MKKEFVRFSVNLDPELAEKLKKCADRSYTSQKTIVNQALEMYFANVLIGHMLKDE